MDPDPRKEPILDPVRIRFGRLLAFLVATVRGLRGHINKRIPEFGSETLQKRACQELWFVGCIRLCALSGPQLWVSKPGHFLDSRTFGGESVEPSYLLCQYQSSHGSYGLKQVFMLLWHEPTARPTFPVLMLAGLGKL